MNKSSGTTVSLRLDDAELFRQQCFVAGRWVDAESNETIDVTNPATNEGHRFSTKYGRQRDSDRYRRCCRGVVSLA